MPALPNAISLLRALAVVPVVLLIAPGTMPWALGLFAAAALTDAVDGPLARRLGAASRLGTFLDPLADKVLVLGTLGALLVRGLAEPLPVELILGREVVVTAARALAAGRGVVVGASAYGKVKATLQGIAVAIQLSALAAPDLGLGPLAALMLALTAGVTVATGIEVIRRAAPLAAPVPPSAVRAHAR